MLLHNVTRRTTYMVEHHHDGSWLHMRFSRYSSARLVVYWLPEEFELRTVLGSFPYPKKYEPLMVHVPQSKAELSTLVDMCKTCTACERDRVYHKELEMRGVLRNVKTGQCVTMDRKTKRVRLQECNRQVWPMIISNMVITILALRTLDSSCGCRTSTSLPTPSCVSPATSPPTV